MGIGIRERGRGSPKDSGETRPEEGIEVEVVEAADTATCWHNFRV